MSWHIEGKHLAPVGALRRVALLVAATALVAVALAGCARDIALEVDGLKWSVSRSPSPSPAPQVVAPSSPSSTTPGELPASANPPSPATDASKPIKGS